MILKLLKWILIAIVTLAILILLYSGPLSKPKDNHSLEPAAVTLANTYWRATELHGEAINALSRNEAHLVFSPNGQLAGADGCNRLVGNYSVNESQLAIGQLAATRMFCGDAMADAERFTLELYKITHFSIQGQRLLLLDADGNTRIRLDAVTR